MVEYHLSLMSNYKIAFKQILYVFFSTVFTGGNCVQATYLNAIIGLLLACVIKYYHEITYTDRY